MDFLRSSEHPATAAAENQAGPSPFLEEYGAIGHNDRRARNNCRRPCDGMVPVDFTRQFQELFAGKADYISETIDEQLQKRLDSMGISKEIALTVLRDINEFGQPAGSMLPLLMQKNRVLGMGEMHAYPNPQRDMGAALMSKLKEAGATQIAIEAGSDIQAMLDSFTQPGGKLEIEALPSMLQDKSYVALLQAAKEAGLRIVAVDRRNRHDSDDDAAKAQIAEENSKSRDQIMAGNIEKVLAQNPRKNKVIFWVGSFHLNHNSNQASEPTAADILRTNTDVSTIFPVFDGLRGTSFHALPEITGGLKQTVTLSTTQAKNVGELPYGTSRDIDGPFVKDWDYIIAYPHSVAR